MSQKSIIVLCRFLLIKLLLFLAITNFTRLSSAENSVIEKVGRVEDLFLPSIVESKTESILLLSISFEPQLFLGVETQRPVPWLLETFRTNDAGLTWTFTLRDRIEWSDGQALDTEDVIFTLDRILDTGDDNTPPAVELRASVESYAAVDAFEFIVTLRKPDLRFPQKFFTARREGTFHVLPQHIWEGKPADFGRDPQSTDFLEEVDLPIAASKDGLQENAVTGEATCGLFQDL